MLYDMDYYADFYLDTYLKKYYIAWSRRFLGCASTYNRTEDLLVWGRSETENTFIPVNPKVLTEKSFIKTILGYVGLVPT